MAIADWTTDPYPAPRLKRGVPSSTPAPPEELEPALAPRVRFWSQRVRIAANQTSRVTSPKFRGVAILKDLTGSCVAGGAAVPTEVLVQLFIAAAPQADAAVAGQLQETAGVNICDTSFTDSTIVMVPSGHDGFIWRLDGTAAQMFQQRLDYVVYDPEFFIAIVLRNPHATNGMTLDATVRIYEDCDRERLPLLMG
jgi:hypothetical protein